MHWIAISFLGFALVGCVPAEKYNALKLAYEADAQKLANAESQLRGAQAEADAHKRHLQALMDNNNDGSAAFANVNAQLIELQGRYGDLQKRYEEAINKLGSFQPLPPMLANALTDFANANPDIVDFDSSKGIVKFKSDVTFNTGSAELRSEARSVINKFAQILNSPAASGYELQVAGHTDSQQVKNQATIKAGHFDNWYLSSHRAITVGKALMSQNIAPNRIATVGYAEQHPIASNASESGRAQNRRVEVLILPNQVRTTAAAGEATQTPTPAPAPAKTSKAPLNKDTPTANTDARPLLNK
jgi:chemotaxis protein MotB